MLMCGLKHVLWYYLTFSGLLRLHSITILEYLSQQVKMRDQSPLLLMSKDVFEGCACLFWYYCSYRVFFVCFFFISGKYPADCLEHSSLMYLYSYVVTALQAVLATSANCATLNTSISLEIVSQGFLSQRVQLLLASDIIIILYLHCLIPKSGTVGGCDSVIYGAALSLIVHTWSCLTLPEI